MAHVSGRPTRCYRIADALTLRVTGPAALLRPFDAFYGPMTVRGGALSLRHEAGTPEDGPMLEVTIKPFGPIEAEHMMEQSYRGGRWRVGVSSVGEPAVRADVAVDRLGRVMVAQAGVGSLVRWLLGGLGFAWLHAAALVRDGRALVLAGPSGVGKSQLVLRLIAGGWRYTTDDHALVSQRGLSGLTTPVLVRGYGGWPEDLPQPTGLRASRLRSRIFRSVSGGRVNLMCGYTPGGDAVMASPKPVILPTTVALLSHGDAVTVSPVDASEALSVMDEQMRKAGRFLDGLMRSSALFDGDAFWREQRGVLRSWLQATDCHAVTVPSRIDGRAAREASALLGLGGQA